MEVVGDMIGLTDGLAAVLGEGVVVVVQESDAGRQDVVLNRSDLLTLLAAI